MGSGSFRFKRFEVVQTGAAMKVGTDGVLLGAWARFDGSERRVLDVGTGTGLLALMAAQRTEGAAVPPRIDAVEIDPQSARQAAENVAASPWADRIAVTCAPVQTFEPGVRYDRILSNPPYFSGRLVCPDRRRTLARHDTSLSFAQLIESLVRLLAPGGSCSLVLPAEAGRALLTEAALRGLFPQRRTEVFTRRGGTEPARLLLELGDRPVPIERDALRIAGEGAEDYSAAYRALTRDFYLHF